MGDNSGKKWEEQLYWDRFQTVHFFQSLTGRYLRELAIPQKFVKNLGEKLEGNVTLRGPSGVGWKVEISAYGDTLYFWTGWKEFVQSYSLKENNVLFFKYTKNTRCFDVLLFDQANFCEKEASYFVKAPDKDQNAESSQKRKEQSSREGDTSKKPRQDDGNKENSAPRSAQAPKPYRMPATDEQKQKALDEATKLAATCSGTAFVTVMRKSHVSSGYYLPIPTKWASEYVKSARQYKHVNLHFEGKQWLITISYKEKSCGLSVGWKKFVTDNDVQESDVVLFRYYYCSSDTINVKIRIFRVLEKGVLG